GQMGHAVGQQLLGAGLLAVVQADDGVYRLAPVLVGDADHGALGHRRVRLEHVLHLAGVDVVPPAHHHVRRAVEDVEVAALVELAHVAGMAPTAPEGVGRGLRVPPVAGHDDLTPAEDLARLTEGQRVVVVGADSDLYTRPGDA